MKQPKPKVYVDKTAGYWLFDILLERWNAQPKMFPYDQPRAVIPQTIIPDHIRQHNNPETIYFFYMVICIWMRGGIESIQAFKAVIKMYRDHPELFDPYEVQHWKQSELQPIVKAYIGWDSKNAARFWIENAKRVMRNWDGKPSQIFKGITTFEEAVRRIKNKGSWSRKKRAEANASQNDGLGFMGYKEKMVAMLVYFIDWEGLLPKRFIYPTPADFHNFRLALAHRVIRLDPQPLHLRDHELISAPWRELTMEYMRERKADPVELADAVWLFSLELCGNSPLTEWRNKQDVALEDSMGLDEEIFAIDKRLHLFAPKYRNRIQRTCLACPLLDTCELAIPAGPYYQRRGDREEAFGGQLYLLDRFPVEHHLTPIPFDYLPAKIKSEDKADENKQLLDNLPNQKAPKKPETLRELRKNISTGH